MKSTTDLHALHNHVVRHVEDLDLGVGFRVEGWVCRV